MPSCDTMKTWADSGCMFGCLSCERDLMSVLGAYQQEAKCGDAQEFVTKISASNQKASNFKEARCGGGGGGGGGGRDDGEEDDGPPPCIMECEGASEDMDMPSCDTMKTWADSGCMFGCLSCERDLMSVLGAYQQEAKCGDASKAKEAIEASSEKASSFREMPCSAGGNSGGQGGGRGPDEPPECLDDCGITDDTTEEDICAFANEVLLGEDVECVSDCSEDEVKFVKYVAHQCRARAQEEEGTPECVSDCPISEDPEPAEICEVTTKVLSGEEDCASDCDEAGMEFVRKHNARACVQSMTAEEKEAKKIEQAEKRAEMEKKREEKRKEAEEKKAAAQAKKEEMMKKRDAAKAKKETMIAKLEGKKKKKAEYLANAMMDGGNVTKVKATLTAATADEACDAICAKMKLSNCTTDMYCEATLKQGRRLLASYDTDVQVSDTVVDTTAALSSLEAEGVTATAETVDASTELSSIDGVDTTALNDFTAAADESAAATQEAEVAEAEAEEAEEEVEQVEEELEVIDETLMEIEVGGEDFEEFEEAADEDAFDEDGEEDAASVAPLLAALVAAVAAAM